MSENHIQTHLCGVGSLDLWWFHASDVWKRMRKSGADSGGMRNMYEKIISTMPIYSLIYTTYDGEVYCYNAKSVCYCVGMSAITCVNECLYYGCEVGFSGSRWWDIHRQSSSGVVESHSHFSYMGAYMCAFMCADSGWWRHSYAEVVSRVCESVGGVGTICVGSGTLLSTYVGFYVYIHIYMCATIGHVLGVRWCKWVLHMCDDEEEDTDYTDISERSGCRSTSIGGGSCWCYCQLVCGTTGLMPMVWRCRWWRWPWCVEEGKKRTNGTRKWIVCGLCYSSCCSGEALMWWWNGMMGCRGWRVMCGVRRCWVLNHMVLLLVRAGGAGAMLGCRLVRRLVGLNGCGPVLKRSAFSENTSQKVLPMRGLSGQKDLWLLRKMKNKFSHTIRSEKKWSHPKGTVQSFRGPVEKKESRSLFLTAPVAAQANYVCNFNSNYLNNHKTHSSTDDIIFQQQLRRKGLCATQSLKLFGLISNYVNNIAAAAPTSPHECSNFDLSYLNKQKRCAGETFTVFKMKVRRTIVCVIIWTSHLLIIWNSVHNFHLADSDYAAHQRNVSKYN